MPTDIIGWFVLIATSLVTFIAARHFGKDWRARRREREEQKAREGESRQVRRARERKGR